MQNSLGVKLMRHSYGLNEMGLTSPFVLIGLFILGVLIFAIFYDFMKKSNPEKKRLTEFLNTRFAKGEIGEESYHEIKMIIEDETSERPSMMIAKERFAKGEIPSEQFIKIRDLINSTNR